MTFPVSSGSHIFVFSSHTCPAHSGTSPQRCRVDRGNRTPGLPQTPDVNLSIHPAPDDHHPGASRPQGYATTSRFLSVPRLTKKPGGSPHPLRSARVTRLHRYYGMIRPLHGHRYSPLSRFTVMGSPLPSRAGFPRSTKEPRPSSCQLYAGCRPARRQGARWTCPGRVVNPQFRHHR